MTIILVLAVACLFTCIVEVLYTATLQNRKTWMKGSLVCNVLTNPALNMLYPAVDYFFTVILWKAGLDRATARILCYVILIAMEAGIVFLEAWIYGFFLPNEPYKKRLAVSAKANLASFVFGLFLSSASICTCKPTYYI